MAVQAGDDGFLLPAVALRTGNRRRGGPFNTEPSGGKLRALLSTWRPSSRRKLSLPTAHRRSESHTGEQQDFFGLSGVSSEREIRTAVHYCSRSDESFPHSFSNSAPLLRANSQEGGQMSSDFCQLTTSPLKYVKKSRDSLLGSSDDDSSGDETHPPWRQGEQDEAAGQADASGLKISEENGERMLLALARAKASLATGKEQANTADTLPRRPHSAPAYPSSLAYAIEALRLSKESSLPQSLTVPAARSSTSCRPKPGATNSQRNSVGQDSAIGLDDGRVSSLSSATSSSSSTPACQPNNPARRPSTTISTPSSTLTPSISQSSCGSVTAFTIPGDLSSLTMSVPSDASLMSLNGSRGTDEMASVGRSSSPSITPQKQSGSLTPDVVNDHEPTIVARTDRISYPRSPSTYNDQPSSLAAQAEPVTSRPGDRHDVSSSIRTSMADTDDFGGLRRSNSVSSAFEPRKEGSVRRNLLDVISPSIVSVRMSSSETTLSASDSSSTLTLAPAARPRSLVVDDALRSASHTDILEAIEEPLQTPTPSPHDSRIKSDNKNGDVRELEGDSSDDVLKEHDTVPELPRLKKNYFALSFGASRRRRAMTSSEDPRRRSFHREHTRRHSTGAIGNPSNFRRVGRLVAASSAAQVEPYPDGVRRVELLRPPDGPYGFYIALSRHATLQSESAARRLVISRITDDRQRKLLAGIMAEGDEILEVNGVNVRGGRCNLQEVYDLMKNTDRLCLVTLPLLERHDW